MQHLLAILNSSAARPASSAHSDGHLVIDDIAAQPVWAGRCDGLHLPLEYSEAASDALRVCELRHTGTRLEKSPILAVPRIAKQSTAPLLPQPQPIQ